MPDITAISATLTGLKTATDIVQLFIKTDFSLEKAELKLKLAKLMEALADAKLNIADIQLMIHEKDEEINKLKESLNLKKKLIRHGDSYYEMDEKGDPIGGPYCSHCFEVKHLAVHINQDPKRRSQNICPLCKNHYNWHP